MLPPRQVPSRDDYYMGQAFFVAAKSKDPNTQVGCVIISSENVPVASGYNGPPKEMNDDEVNWARPVRDSLDVEERLGKYPFMVHSEDNAIKHSDRNLLKGATIYVTAPPCRACMLDIVEAGIKRVVFYLPKGDPTSMTQSGDEHSATQLVARKGRVKLEEFKGDLSWMVDHYRKLEAMGIFQKPE